MRKTWKNIVKGSRYGAEKLTKTTTKESKGCKVSQGPSTNTLSGTGSAAAATSWLAWSAGLLVLLPSKINVTSISNSTKTHAKSMRATHGEDPQAAPGPDQEQTKTAGFAVPGGFVSGFAAPR